MKFIETRPFADPEVAARKLMEIANSVEPVQDRRIHIEKINWPFLSEHRSPTEYSAGLKLANQSVVGARGALQVAGGSCVSLEKSSVSISDASEAIRCSIADITLQASSAAETIGKLVDNVGHAQQTSRKLERVVEKSSFVVGHERRHPSVDKSVQRANKCGPEYAPGGGLQLGASLSQGGRGRSARLTESP